MSFEVAAKQIKKTREEILLELKNSLETNNAIGIFLKDTRELVTTAVLSIEENAGEDYLVILMDEDLHGYPLQRNRILLSNIDRVIHFNISFDDPLFIKVRKKFNT